MRIDDLIQELDGRIEDHTFDLKRSPPKVDDMVCEIQGGMNGLAEYAAAMCRVDGGCATGFRQSSKAKVKM